MRENKISLELSRVKIDRQAAQRRMDFGSDAYRPIDLDQSQSREKDLNAWFFKRQSSHSPLWSTEARGEQQSQVLLDHAYHELFKAAPASYTVCLSDVLKQIESNWSHSAQKTLEKEQDDEFWTSTRSQDNEQRCIDHR
jgi:hypothetical protein